MSKFDFKLALPFGKAERDGEWYLTALASGPETDSQNERMAPSALQGIVRQVEREAVPFLNWHNKNDALGEMGDVAKAWLTEDFHMGVEIRLDQDDSNAQKLWKKLDTVNPRTGKPYEFGLSVAGKGDYKDEYEKSQRVRTYYDVELEEISLTTKPIYTPSLGTVLRKAADESSVDGDKSMEKDTPDTTPVVEEKEVEKAPEAPASAPEVTEPVTPAVEEKEVEKAVSADTKARAKTIKEVVGLHRQMSTLIAELVLSEGESETATVDSAPTVEGAPVKSEETADSAAIQKAADEIARLTAEVNELKDRIPATEVPEVQIKKSDTDEAREQFAALSTYDQLRLALAVKTGGK